MKEQKEAQIWMNHFVFHFSCKKMSYYIDISNSCVKIFVIITSLPSGCSSAPQMEIIHGQRINEKQQQSQQKPIPAIADARRSRRDTGGLGLKKSGEVGCSLWSMKNTNIDINNKGH